MKRIKNKETLYDGLERQELYSSSFNVNNAGFILSAILDNKFEDLKNQISQEDFMYIVTGSGIQHYNNPDFGEFYRSQEGLSLYCSVKDDCIYVFAFGEKQPGRYVLTSEGIWEK